MWPSVALSTADRSPAPCGFTDFAGFSRAIPCFWKSAAPILDLYRGVWQGQPWDLRILYFALTKSRTIKHNVGSTLRAIAPYHSSSHRARV